MSNKNNLELQIHSDIIKESLLNSRTRKIQEMYSVRLEIRWPHSIVLSLSFPKTNKTQHTIKTVWLHKIHSCLLLL